MFNLKFFNKKNDSMIAVYDLDKINCSYDFVIFFQNAILYKKKKNIKTLDLCLIKGSVDGFKKNQFSREINDKLDNAISRLNNIVIPAIMMFRKHYRNFYLIDKREEANKILNKYQNFFPHNFHLKMDKGFYCRESVWARLEENHKEVDLAELYVPEVLTKKIIRKINTQKKIISITLRESSFRTERNSIIKEWESFVEYLERKGYYVIVLRDTETVYRDNLFEKNIIFPHASYDLYLRSAIYKISYANYFVNSGPSIICWVNNYKSIFFKAWGIKENREANEDNLGIEKNEQSKVLDNNMHFLVGDIDENLNLIKFHEKNLM